MAETKGKRRSSNRSPEAAMVSPQQNILLTWVGSHDPTGWNPRTKSTELGPILSLLEQREFDAVYLLSTSSASTMTSANGRLRSCGCAAATCHECA